MAGVGGVFVAVAVGIPIALIHGPKLMRRLPVASGADEGAGMLGLLALIGLVAALVGVARGRRPRTWLRLGTLTIVLLLILFGGKVATVVAYQSGGWWSSWPIVGSYRLPVAFVAVAWLLVLDGIAAHRLTLGGVHRKRLAATFALAGGDGPPLPPLAHADEPQWDDYAAADGPELIIAATAHSSTRTFSGVHGHACTFRPDRVTLFDRADGTSAWVPMASYPQGSWWDGFPRGWLVSRSMALTGGGIASTVGRETLGATHAMMVTLNLRHGAWVPNPRYVEWFADASTAPRVHLGYLMKELFGRFDPARDAFVYVADGAFREPLGLVELLRERPDVVCCIDACVDRAGSFQSLRAAIEMATVELDVDIDLDLDRLRVAEGADLPLDCAAEGRIVFPATMGGGSGRILYGCHQLSEAASPALLQFGAAHPRFPGDVGRDRSISEEEHLQLVALGEHVAARIVSLFAGVSA